MEVEVEVKGADFCHVGSGSGGSASRSGYAGKHSSLSGSGVKYSCHGLTSVPWGFLRGCRLPFRAMQDCFESNPVDSQRMIVAHWRSTKKPVACLEKGKRKKIYLKMAACLTTEIVWQAGGLGVSCLAQPGSVTVNLLHKIFTFVTSDFPPRISRMYAQGGERKAPAAEIFYLQQREERKGRTYHKRVRGWRQGREEIFTTKPRARPLSLQCRRYGSWQDPRSSQRAGGGAWGRKKKRSSPTSPFRPGIKKSHAPHRGRLYCTVQRYTGDVGLRVVKDGNARPTHGTK